MSTFALLRLLHSKGSGLNAVLAGADNSTDPAIARGVANTAGSANLAGIANAESTSDPTNSIDFASSASVVDFTIHNTSTQSGVKTTPVSAQQAPAKTIRKPRAASINAQALSVIAFAAATAIFLTVLGGLHAFITRASADGTVHCYFNTSSCASGTYEQFVQQMEEDPATSMVGFYVTLAIFASILLLVPFVTLAGSAARLAAARRDKRLAALRLIGVTTDQVVRLTALEATGQALIGALVGVIGYVALMPLIMMLHFQSRTFSFGELWVGVPAIVLTIAAVALLALCSALLTLRRVAITPLAVSAQTPAPLPGKWRVVIFVGVVAVTLVAFNSLSAISRVVGSGAVMAFIMVQIGICFALFNLVGTWLVAFVAKVRVKRPKRVYQLIANRRILANPKRAWRNVSGIALAVFIAGMTSLTGAFSAETEGLSANDPSLIMMQDIRTGGLLTLAFAAVLAAVSSGVMQAGSVLDQTQQYRTLVLEGTDERTLAKARMSEVIVPLTTVVVVSASFSILLLVPLFASSLVQAGVVLSFLGGIALCYALVAVGAISANRMAAALNRVQYRADD